MADKQQLRDEARAEKAVTRGDIKKKTREDQLKRIHDVLNLMEENRNEIIQFPIDSTTIVDNIENWMHMWHQRIGEVMPYTENCQKHTEPCCCEWKEEPKVYNKMYTEMWKMAGYYMRNM